MEPNYNYNGWFNTDAWMHQYAALQEQQRTLQGAGHTHADQAGVEQRLGELQLDSSGESAAEAGSPDAGAKEAGSPQTRPAQTHRGFRRTDIGGSMRMPPRSSRREDWFSSGRHSVDLPRAHIGGSAAGESQSDLRERLFSSSRYTAPSEVRPLERTKDSKSRGLLSRIKSRFGKAFGRSRREKSSGVSASGVVSSEHHMDLVKRSRPSAGGELHPQGAQQVKRLAVAYSDDDRIIASLVNDAEHIGGQKKEIILDLARAQRTFSGWLRSEKRGSIMSRINGSDAQQRSLTADYKEFRKGVGRNSTPLSLPTLRKQAQLLETNRAMGVASTEQARWGIGRTGSQTGGYDQEQLWGDVDQAGGRGPVGWNQPRSGPSSDFFRGVGYPVELSATPQELRDDASSQDRSGRALGARAWLGDEHIHRDYELLAEELVATDPNLAARTRFVDPLVVQQLRLAAQPLDMMRAFQRIVFRNGEDTADFLFLPVSDAGEDPDRRGSHWSLLLVDRSNRESRPVAYHYDSALGHNDEPAAQLATRLGATLARARIAQQRNGYDCGVYVLDGTRDLVSQLTQGQRPELLNLNNLIPDRQALQNRLSG